MLTVVSGKKLTATVRTTHYDPMSHIATTNQSPVKRQFLSKLLKGFQPKDSCGCRAFAYKLVTQCGACPKADKELQEARFVYPLQPHLIRTR